MSTLLIFVSTSYPRPEEDEEKAKNVWLKGHTGTVSYLSDTRVSNIMLADIGTVTVLWSQTVSALQILCPDGKWRWIKHIDNALVSVVFFMCILALLKSIGPGCEHR